MKCVARGFRQPALIPSTAVLDDLVAACAAGAHSKIGFVPRDWFNELLMQYTEKHLVRLDCIRVDLINAAGRQGLLAARAGQAEAAREHFGHGQELLDMFPLSDEGRKLAESLFGAQCAYDHYRRQEDAVALQLLERSFCNDILLEEERGYNVLRIHRVQLLNNMMRIHARRERWPDALMLGHALLTHLEFPGRGVLEKLSPPWNQGWSGGFVGIPIELVNTMHAQIAAEEVQALDQATTEETSWGDVGAALRSIRIEQDGSQVGLWIDFQLARFDPELGDVFAAAIQVLQRGAVPSEPLWRSVVECTSTLIQEILNGQFTS